MISNLKSLKDLFSKMEWLQHILASILLIPIYIYFIKDFQSLERNLLILNDNIVINVFYSLVKYCILLWFYAIWFSTIMYFVIVALRKFKKIILRILS